MSVGYRRLKASPGPSLIPLSCNLNADVLNEVFCIEAELPQ